MPPLCPRKMLLMALGILLLVLATVGLFLPLLPTTPFILLSAWCFSHSSPRLHRFLIHNKIFGPLIENWNQHGAISGKAKMSATLVIGLFFGYTLIFVSVHPGVKIAIVTIGAALLLFIWSRPRGPG